MRGVTSLHFTPPSIDQISTRTPHAGSDRAVGHPLAPELISTRSPHAGSDYILRACYMDSDDFNPHSPCGE